MNNLFHGFLGTSLRRLPTPYKWTRAGYLLTYSEQSLKIKGRFKGKLLIRDWRNKGKGYITVFKKWWKNSRKKERHFWCLINIKWKAFLCSLKMAQLRLPSSLSSVTVANLLSDYLRSMKDHKTTHYLASELHIWQIWFLHLCLPVQRAFINRIEVNSSFKSLYKESKGE